MAPFFLRFPPDRRASWLFGLSQSGERPNSLFSTAVCKQAYRHFVWGADRPVRSNPFAQGVGEQVKLTMPAAWSIVVVCTVAISC